MQDFIIAEVLPLLPAGSQLWSPAQKRSVQLKGDRKAANRGLATSVTAAAKHPKGFWESSVAGCASNVI